MNAGIRSTSSIPLRRSSQRLLTLTSTTQLCPEQQDSEGSPPVEHHAATIQLWTGYLPHLFLKHHKTFAVPLFRDVTINNLKNVKRIHPNNWVWVNKKSLLWQMHHVYYVVAQSKQMCGVDIHERVSLQHTGTHTIHHTVFADSRLIVNVPDV